MLFLDVLSGFDFSDNAWTFLTGLLGMGNILQFAQFLRTRRQDNIKTKKDLYDLLDELKNKHLRDSARMEAELNQLRSRVYDLEKERQMLQLHLLKHNIEIPVFSSHANPPSSTAQL